MMRRFLIPAMIILALAGCSSLDSGTILNRKVETGRTEYDCDTKGTGKNKTTKCSWEALPDKCMFELRNEKGERGWLEVSCANEFNQYKEGDHYPR